MKGIVFIVFLLLSQGISTAYANNNSVQAELQLIMLSLQKGEVSLDNELHDRFWNNVNEMTKGDPELTRALTEELYKQLPLAFEIQVETWKSALISLERGELIESDKFQLAWYKQRDYFEQFAKDTNMSETEYKKLKISINEKHYNSLKIIRSAAENRQLTLSTGSSIHVNRELIDHMLSTLSPKLQEFKNLLNPEWKES